MSFVHLHNHSHYSILEWLPKPKDYVKKAKEFGMSAIALTDTSNIHGCHELYTECVKAWITPILWTEIYVESSLDSTLNHKLVLLAKNLDGYKNIIALTSKASLENWWGISKVTFDDLRGNVDNVVCLSWPINGEIPYYILSWKSEEAILQRIAEYTSVFWKENYYLELIYHDDIPKQKLVTDTLIELNKNHQIPVVATNNCFYVDPEDSRTQDVIQALWTGHEIENPDRTTLMNGNYSLLDEENMQILFGFLPEALSNTQKIADMVSIEIETWGVLIPTFELPEKDNERYESVIESKKKNTGPVLKKLDSSEWYLRYLSFKWLNWRFDYWLDDQTIYEFIKKLDKPSLDKELTETSPEELKELSLIYYTDEKKELLSKLSQEQQDFIERLEYELVVIHEMWFDAYFLIVADYINWARDNDIPVWPWRWSAAGSLMAFLSWITDIDPMKYDLLFERFLNPARISMPDIDTDFADNERDRVVEYCRNKYGADRVAQICTFGTFAARAAVKDVWRVYGIPFAEMNALVKLIPEKPGTKLQGALQDSPEFFEAYDTNEKYKEIIDNALKIEWNVRQLWVHACAVIIAPQPMTNFTALQHPPKDSESIITQYSANPLEDLGLLKMDFLWLRNLTIIKRAQKIIKNSKWDDFDILQIDTADQKSFEIFAEWDTTWVFQFESDGMRKYLKDLQPNTFDDIIAMVSLYRPGPLAYIPTYIDRKFWREDIKYMTDDLVEILKKKYSDEEIEEQKMKLNEDLKQILDVSYGIAVYQEQLMFIVQYMAGFSLWEADLLRRWIWKKKIEVIEALKKEFIIKSESYKQYKPEVSRYIYEEMIQPAANYSFNKSHAACYAFIAYQTAYLKAYYPTEFLTSVMISDEENMERIVLEVAESESKWISVLPPSVQESLKHFTYIDDDNIRFWLKAIKWIWEGPIDRIIEARKEAGGKFNSLEDFIEFCWNEVINKKSLEALILAWAMDDLWERRQMFDSILDIIRFCRKDEKKKQTSQIGLFDNSDEFEDILELIEGEPFTFEEKLRWEKEVIWIYVSGHPLDGLSRYCNRRSSNTKKLKMSMQELQEIYDRENEWKDAEQKKKDKKDEKEEVVQAVGVIIDIRKIITKTWKTMMFLKCEWFDYDFEVVLFPRDLDKYKEKVEEDKVIIVNGTLDVNFEYGRKSIRTRDMKFASIAMIREQATDLWLFNTWKRFLHKHLNDTADLENSESNESESGGEKFDENLEEKINIGKQAKELQLVALDPEVLHKFVVDIPHSAMKQDLHELKEFLLTQHSWDIKVFINLKWQEISTKISVEDIGWLEEWMNKKWK